MNRNPNRIFWIIVGILLVYNYLFPLSSQELRLNYSCIIIANDAKGSIIGSINAVSFLGDTVRNVNIPKVELIPAKIREAVIASEDHTFFDKIRNFLGVNWRGIARAFFKGDGGGSGLVQQLVRVLFLDYPYTKNFNRKVTEVIVGMNIGRTYTRDELFLAYINNAPLGSNIYGFRTAAAHYFGKTPNKLTWNEVATLVGALRNPRSLTDNALAQKKRNEVLFDLWKQAAISEQEYLSIKNTPVNLKPLDPQRKNKPFFNDARNSYEGFFLAHVKQETKQILEKLGRNGNDFSGLRIVTTYQPAVQQAAEDALLQRLRGYPDSLLMPQVGLVSIEHKSGKIRAMIGANPLTDSVGIGTNHANNLRQAGSTFKPFAYGALLSKRRSMSLEAKLPDYPVPSFEWNPQNFDGTYSSQMVSLRRCLAQSLNIPTANMMKQRLVSPQEVITFARNCGITSQRLPADAPLVLGSGDVTALELASAYATIAQNGTYNKPFSIVQIRNSKNQELYHYTNSLVKRVGAINSRVAKNLKAALEEVVNKGTARRVRGYYKGYAAGKTGTTSQHRDAWFVGFNGQLSTAIWFGYDNRQPLPNGYDTGGSTAAPLWGAMMAQMDKMVQKK